MRSRHICARVLIYHLDCGRVLSRHRHVNIGGWHVVLVRVSIADMGVRRVRYYSPSPCPCSDRVM